MLADEINRTPPKTQAALLEAMQEHSVTVGGKTIPGGAPSSARHPEPDRAGRHLSAARGPEGPLHVPRQVGSPQRRGARDRAAHHRRPFAKLEGIISGAEIMACQETVRKVLVSDHVMISCSTWSARPAEGPGLRVREGAGGWGAGPRACQQWVLGGKVRVVLQGRFHVTLDDMVALATPAPPPHRAHVQRRGRRDHRRRSSEDPRRYPWGTRRRSQSGARSRSREERVLMAQTVRNS